MIVTVVGLAFEARIAARAGMRAVCGGDGRNLATSLNHAVMRGCSGLISFGVAGGLSPELRPGSCVVASSVHSAAAQYMTDPTWSRTLMRLIPNAVHGAIVGVSRPVAETDGKRALYRDTGALAVDMESHIVASVASAHRLPMIAIRVVTDPAERALPKVALAAVRPTGTINMTAVICALLKRPHELPALVRMAVDLNAARATLQQGLQVLGSVPVGQAGARSLVALACPV